MPDLINSVSKSFEMIRQVIMRISQNKDAQRRHF
jgi:hypothetical protein